MTYGRVGIGKRISAQSVLKYMAKDPNKLYPASELDTYKIMHIGTHFSDIVDEQLSSGTIQEVSEKTYQITSKGIDIVADELRRDLWKHVKEKSNEDFYTIDDLRKAFPRIKLAKMVFHKAIEKLCQTDSLKKILTRDETTNIERVVYAVTKETISARVRFTGFTSEALKLEKAELKVIKAIGTKGGSNFTLEERASRVGLTPQNFKQLMEELIVKGFVKRKMTRRDSSKKVPTIFLTKKGAEVYNVLYQRERKKQLPPVQPLTHAERRTQEYDYEVRLRRLKDRKGVIISIVVFVVAVLIVVLVGVLL